MPFVNVSSLFPIVLLFGILLHCAMGTAASPFTAIQATESSDCPWAEELALRIACAEGDLAVACVNEQLEYLNRNANLRLYHEGQCSWIEKAQAECAHRVAIARRLNAQRFREWVSGVGVGDIQQNGQLRISESITAGSISQFPRLATGTEVRNSAPEATTIQRQQQSHRYADRIEVMIPGSHAVIGWIRPIALSRDDRADFLVFMRQRASISRIDEQTLQASIEALAVAETALRSLKSVSGETSAELEYTQLKRDLAAAQLRQMQAIRQFREFDYQQLNPLSDVSGSDQTIPDRPETESAADQFAVVLQRQAIAILDQELSQKGLARAASVQAALTHFQRRALLELRNSETDLVETQLATFGLPQNQGAGPQAQRSAWLSHWTHKLDAINHSHVASNVVVPAGAQSEGSTRPVNKKVSQAAGHIQAGERRFPVESIPHDVQLDTRRKRRLVTLVQGWCQSDAECTAAQFQYELSSELLARTKKMTQPNQAELMQLKYSKELKDAQMQAAEEQRELLELQIRQVLESLPGGLEPASNLSLIDEESSQILLQVACQRAATDVAGPAKEELSRAMQRRSGLLELQRQGVASRAEIQSADAAVRRAEDLLRAARRQQVLAGIDYKLMAKIMDFRSRQ